ncbi:dihydrouridine synthase [Bifidobacterium callitrichos]|nr:dihydrouridine synthase [Bifidobacterium callitrichos]
MAQQSEAGIPRAGKRKWGYDPAQVDEFLEKAHKLYDSEGAQLTQRDIQNVSFTPTRGGYVIAQVDAALARLERAVVDKQTTWEISHQGRVAWKARTEELYREIAGHVDREERARFADGKGRAPSYDRKQVDRLCEQIVDKCAAELGLDGASADDAAKLDKITSDYVTDVVFTQRKGRRGYDERQVDYFLNTCVELLSRIESFDRLADYIAADGDADGSAASLGSVPRAAAIVTDDASPAASVPPAADHAPSLPTASASVPVSAAPVSPLFSSDARFQRPSESDDSPVGYAPVAPAASASPSASAAKGESFDALSQAEQDLFASASRTTSSPVPALAPSEPVVTWPAASPAAPAYAATPAPSVTQPVSRTAPRVASSSTQASTPAAQFPAASPAAPTTPVSPVPSYTPTPSYIAPSVLPTPAPSATPTPAASAAMPPSFATPPASPTYSAAAPSSHGSDQKYTTSSLDALAQMAEASQEFPKVTGTAPFEPHMPSLDVPNTLSSMPAVTPATPATSAASPAPSTASTAPTYTPPASAPAQAPTAAPAPVQPPKPPFSLLSANNNDLDIPDLSFPSIAGHDAGDVRSDTKEQ